MFVDSHCHLDFPELITELPAVLEAMAAARVTHALCISVTLADWPAVHALAKAHPNLHATAGVHPDYEDIDEPTVATLVAMSAKQKIVAIGETGLDYYRLHGDLEPGSVERTNRIIIELEKRLASRAHDEGAGACALAPRPA